jgi:hypothetical protein
VDVLQRFARPGYTASRPGFQHRKFRADGDQLCRFASVTVTWKWVHTLRGKILEAVLPSIYETLHIIGKFFSRSAD